MSDETTNTNTISLFKELEAIFKKMGFSKQQIVIMDITAGAYLVTNPTGDLPRVICTITNNNELKVEYSQFSESNVSKFSLLLTNLVKDKAMLLEGQIIDTLTGSILEDFEIENNVEFDYSKELTTMVLDNEPVLKSLKLYLTFNITKTSMFERKADKTTKTDIIQSTESKLRFEDETLLILDFISRKTTKCIQSKHLLELYPKSTKSECFRKLKIISERGYLTQSGPWFLLNQQV